MLHQNLLRRLRLLQRLVRQLTAAIHTILVYDEDMNRGAVAIVDALGFKGIWGNVAKPSLAVLQTLKAIGAAAAIDLGKAALLLDRRNLSDEVAMMLKNPFVKVVQLSDTIVVAAGRRPRLRKPWTRHAQAWRDKFGLSVEEFEAAVDSYLRFVVARCVCSILKTAALCTPPLIYRGVVTVGRFAIDENFLLGPAVDEAAELMDLADGPFVWLAPSANRLKEVITDSNGPKWSEMVFEYRVPLKDGREIPTRVLNPFFSCSPSEKKAVRGNILHAMDAPVVDVAVKRGNALRFFNYVTSKEKTESFLKAARQKREKAATAGGA
jgi:hypothetical protein